MKFRIAMLAFFLCSAALAQVGIGTTTPEASSALDISSTTKGLLAPRMTTTQRNAITTPANSLLVYDTDLEAFYYYDTPSTTWKPIGSGTITTRDKYVLVKSAADFPAPSGGKITLDENTLYEINGLITLTVPIELNNAQLLGLDAGEDILFKASGAVFTGTTGGNIKNLTISSTGGGTVFAITGGTNLLFQNCIVAGMSSVGTISGVELYFSNIINYVSNANGITYADIDNLLLNNQGWADTNGGTFETLTGSFDLVEKVSGFSTVPSGATGFDVSSNPSVTSGVLQGTVFSGVGTYIQGYPLANTYPGYNFSINWEVNAPGIPRESDDNASGNFYITRNSTTTNPTFSISGGAAINASIDAGQMFRFSNATPTVTGSNNVLEYEGKESRTFSVRGNLAYEPTTTNGATTVHAFFIRRYSSDGSSIEIPLGTEIYEQVGSSGNASTGDYLVRAIPISGKVTLDPGDYVRIFGQTISSPGTARNSIRVYSVSLTLD